jgi:hypothetical protein
MRYLSQYSVETFEDHWTDMESIGLEVLAVGRQSYTKKMKLGRHMSDGLLDLIPLCRAIHAL